MKRATVVAVIVMFFSISGCSTSGYVRPSANPRLGDKTIYVSTHFAGYEAEYVGKVIRTFEKYGFTTTHDRSAGTYYLDFSIDAGASIMVDIGLLKDGESVLSTSSNNAGWGTLIARPVAVANRVDAAIEKLDALLRKSSRNF